MGPQRIAGICMLIIGVILFFVGMHASHSVVNQTKDFFVGHYTRTTSIYIFGGAALAIAGLLLTLFGARRA